LLWQASLRAERGEVTSGLILLIIPQFMEVGNFSKTKKVPDVGDFFHFTEHPYSC